MVYVRYRDHVVFRNVDPETQSPIVQEAVGWFDHEDEEYLRLIVARYHEHDSNGNTRTKATGFVILKKTILETRRIG